MRELKAAHKKAIDELEGKLRAAEGESGAELQKLRAELEAARRQQESTVLELNATTQSMEEIAAQAKAKQNELGKYRSNTPGAIPATI